MVRKTIALLVLTLIMISSLSAFSWSAEGSANVRRSSTEGTLPEVSIAGTVDGFYFGLLAGGDEYIAFDASWDYISEGSLRFTAGTGINHHYGSGGLATFHFDIGQDFRFFDWLSMGYRGGVQLGISWADGVSMYPFSASPYARWHIGYDDDVLSLIAYGTGWRRFEHTFQAPPVLGVEAGWNIDGSNRVSIDSFMKLADYMDGPDLIVSDVSLRLTYTYRGESL